MKTENTNSAPKTTWPKSPGRLRRLFRKRWVRVTLAIFLLIFLLIYFIPDMMLGPAQKRLEAMFSSNLNARVKIGRLSYSFPYGLNAHRVELFADNPDIGPVALLKIRRLHLSLENLPFGDRPIVVKAVELLEPKIHIVCTEHGIVGVRQHNQNAPSSTTSTSPPASNSISNMAAKFDHFELRHLTIRHGSIVWEQLAGHGAGERLIWQSLNSEIDVKENQTAEWDFHLTGKGQPFANLECEGSIQKEGWALTVDKLEIDANLQHAGTFTSLPPAFQEFVTKNKIAGKLKLVGHGQIPLATPHAAIMTADITLGDGKGHIAGTGTTLDQLSFTAHCSNDPRDVSGWFGLRGVAMSNRSLYIHLADFHAGAGDSSLDIANTGIIIDPDAKTWRVENLAGEIALSRDYKKLGPQAEKALKRFDPQGRGKFIGHGFGELGASPFDAKYTSGWTVDLFPRNAQFLPPDFPLPVTKINGGKVTITPEKIYFHDLAGLHDGDSITLNSADLELARLHEQARLNNIKGNITFDGRDKPYPRWLKPVIDAVHPRGTFQIVGTTFDDLTRHPSEMSFRFIVRTDNAALGLHDGRVQATQVIGDCIITPDEVTVVKNDPLGLRGCHAVIGGGDATFAMNLKLNKDVGIQYRGNIQCKNVDFEQVAKEWKSSDVVPRSAKGKISGKLEFSGQSKTDNLASKDLLRGKGRIDVVQGEFWEFPLFRAVLGRMDLAGDALKGASAGADFSLEDDKTKIENASISSTLVGVQGSGSITFAGQSDLKVVAAPLGNWKKKLNIPIIGDVAGALQKVVNTAQGMIFYEFRVTGEVGNPKIETVPVPILTDSAAKFFGELLKGEPR